MNFEKFCETYQLQLNKQQKDAVKTVDGPVLLLAVPGSGKTTVLVSRLGYMIYCKGIAPRNILTLTYTVAATRDMAARFHKIFGEEDAISDGLEFRTINGICASIINFYGRRIGKEPFKLVSDEKVITRILSMVYQKVQEEYPTESDLKNVRTWIAYIKNRMLAKDEIQALNEKAECNIADIYQLYLQEMKKNCIMDFDDQMVYAYNILRRSPEILSFYQEKYRYICVDEAQDTSKIQHAIIALLASKYENLFMVGDEDQSIYGFRAAYPEALLSFEKQHPGAKVLLMEENFRSNAKIVRGANRFIKKNKHRHEKNMKAARPDGTGIKKLTVGGRKAQYQYLLKVAQNCQMQTAVLYRDHESVLPLVDLLERKKLPYRMRNADLTFFTHRIVLDIQNIIRFAADSYNTELFMQIYYKLSTYLNKQKAAEICQISISQQVPVLDAAIRFGRLPGMTVGSCKKIQTHLANLLNDDAQYAIDRIVQYMGYGEYLERSGMSDGKLFVLKTLAGAESRALGFVNRLEELQKIIREKSEDSQCPFILSTIHASKGLEYDRVYLLDVADGIFPEKVLRNMQDAPEQDQQTFEEERRLFYVGITRAKEELLLFDTGKESVFLKEFLPEKASGPGTDMSGVMQSRRQGKTVQMVKSSGMAEYEQMKRMSAKAKKQEPIGKKGMVSELEYQKFKDSLGEGMIVRHKKAGTGVIARMDQDIITIVFDHNDVKSFQLRICFMNHLLEEI